MKTTDDYIGTHIGNYLRGEKIASGSFGSVYYGKHTILKGRQVAIKVLHAVYLSSEEKRACFLQEAYFLEQLNHPHCLRVYDAGFFRNLPYIISEYAEGGSLRNRIQSHENNILPLHEALEILTQVGEALHYAHQKKIIHRDLKPENILFNAKNEALLADFGIAVVLQATSLQDVNSAGTPTYMAPEQFRNQVSRKSDQYALGCIAYELLTGQPPFSASDAVALGYQHTNILPRPLHEHNPHLPDYVNQAVLKAMAKQREDRFADVATFIAALCNPSFSVRATFAEMPQQFSANTFEIVSEKYQHYIEEGEKLFQSRQYQAAFLAYREALHLDRMNIVAYLKKAELLFHWEKYQEARVVYIQVIHINPHCTEAYIGLGNCLYQRKNYKEALSCYVRALHLDEHNVKAYLGKIRTSFKLKREREALVACDKALRSKLCFGEIYYEKARILLYLQNYSEALDACEQAIMLDPYYASYYALKGYIMYNIQQYEQALTMYEIALSLNPQLALVYYYKGLLFEAIGNKREAKNTYRIAEQLGFSKEHVFPDE